MIALPRLAVVCSLLLVSPVEPSTAEKGRVVAQGQSIAAHDVRTYPGGQVADFNVDAPTWIKLPRDNRMLAPGWVGLYPDGSISLIEASRPFVAKWASRDRTVELNCDPHARTETLPARPRLIQFHPGGEYKAGCATVADLPFTLGRTSVVVAGDLSVFDDFTLAAASEVVRGAVAVGGQSLPIKPRTAIQYSPARALDFLTPAAGTRWRETHPLYGELAFAQRGPGSEIPFAFNDDGTIASGPLAEDTYFPDLELRAPAGSKIYFGETAPHAARAGAFVAPVQIIVSEKRISATRFRVDPASGTICYTLAESAVVGGNRLDSGAEACRIHSGELRSVP